MALSFKQAQSVEVRNKDYKLDDEKGLYLLVKRNGAKYWRVKYRFNSAEKLLSFGVFIIHRSLAAQAAQ